MKFTKISVFWALFLNLTDFLHVYSATEKHWSYKRHTFWCLVSLFPWFRYLKIEERLQSHAKEDISGIRKDEIYCSYAVPHQYQRNLINYLCSRSQFTCSRRTTEKGRRIDEFSFRERFNHHYMEKKHQMNMLVSRKTFRTLRTVCRVSINY